MDQRRPPDAGDGNDGPAREAMPEKDGRLRVRCPECDKDFVVADDGDTPQVAADAPEGLVEVEPIDSLEGESPADRLRVLLAYGRTDRLRAIEILCESWYRDLMDGEDDTMHRVTDLFILADHIYATLEIGEGECRWDERGVLVSEPTLVFVWTFVWGPGTRLAGELEARLIDRFGNITTATDDLGPFVPVLAWWSSGLWRVGFFARIPDSMDIHEIDLGLINVAVRATRRLAHRIASLTLDPATLAPPPSPEER